MLKCIQGYEVRPINSAAGFYMGTFDPEQGPNCRLSSKYAKTYKEAQNLPLDRQGSLQNSMCNSCGKCFIS